MHRGEFLCVDANAEPFANGSAGNEDGAPFFPVETEGPPGFGYNHDWEVACIVCALNSF